MKVKFEPRLSLFNHIVFRFTPFDICTQWIQKHLISNFLIPIRPGLNKNVHNALFKFMSEFRIILQKIVLNQSSSTSTLIRYNRVLEKA